MNNSNQIVVFTLDEQCYALYLSAVERVVRIVEITLLPKAPEIVFGVVNVKGWIIPVINVRRRFRLPEREIKVSDQLIIAQTTKRLVALIIDSVSGIIECSEREVIAAEEILPGMEYVKGVVKLKEGLILIHDIDKCLSLEEEKMLDDAIRKNQKGKK